MSVRDFVEKDFYAVLGVPKTATAAEIKRAYRKLAREHHPDKNPDDAKAEARFKEVSQAYDVLSDETRRREYDEARDLFAAGVRPGAFGPGGFATDGAGGFDVGDLFGGAGGGLGDVLGNLFGGGRATRAPSRGADLAAEVTVGFPDSLHGLEATVRLPGGAACDVCHGSGAAAGTTPRVCPTCGGHGMVAHNQGGFAFTEPCRDCRGSGRIVDQPCPACGGTGARERLQKIRIPAGVRDGQRLRVRGRGAPGPRGAPRGDLEVTVHVVPHPVFGREGDALTLTLPVTFPEAALGATVTVPTLDGQVTLKIPAGTASGRRLRVKDRGFPVRGGRGGRGPLIVTIDVAVPAKLSPKAREALATFAEETPGDPRAAITAMAGASSAGAS
jgi:molecular chaperone DnaJ